MKPLIEDVTARLRVRNDALDALAAGVDQPDLSEWEVTIAGLGLDRSSHTHGDWTPGHTPSGHVRWHCDGCHYSPPVMVRLPDVGQAIIREWWDGYRVDTARALVES